MRPSRDPPGSISCMASAPIDPSPSVSISESKGVHATLPDHLAAERRGVAAMTGIFRGLIVGLPLTLLLWGAILWIVIRLIQ